MQQISFQLECHVKYFKVAWNLCDYVNYLFGCNYDTRYSDCLDRDNVIYVEENHLKIPQISYLLFNYESYLS